MAQSVVFSYDNADRPDQGDLHLGPDGELHLHDADEVQSIDRRSGNCVQHNQPGLVKLADVGVMLSQPVCSTIGLLVWGAESLLATNPIALLYLPLGMYSRAKYRPRLQEMVDDMLSDLQRGRGPWSLARRGEARTGRTETVKWDMFGPRPSEKEQP